MCVDRPDSAARFDDWVVARLLNPASAMFREGSALLYEEPELGEDDALRSRRPVCQVTGPLVRLQHLIVRPQQARLVGRRRAHVWAESQDTVASLIYGPHLEDLARNWCTEHADPETLGGIPSRCEPAVIACREHTKSHQLDVVVSADPPGEKSRILAIGEVKATSWVVGLDQLERLRHIRSLLPATAVAREPKLLPFSRQGFTPELTTEARSHPDVDLIDFPRLYHGS